MKAGCLLLFLMWSTCSIAQIRIDGSITYSEFADTAVFRNIYQFEQDVIVKSSAEEMYIGIQTDFIGTVNVLLQKGDEYIILHVSACTGRGIYKQTGDSLRIVKQIRSVRKYPEEWDYIGEFVWQGVLNNPARSDQETAERRRMCYKKFGYMADTFDEGSYTDVEVLLDKKFFSGYRMMVQTNRYSKNGNKLMPTKVFYPAIDTGEVAAFEKILDARQTVFARVDTSRWLSID